MSYHPRWDSQAEVLRGVPGSPLFLTGLEYLEESSLLSIRVGWPPNPLLKTE